MGTGRPRTWSGAALTGTRGRLADAASAGGIRRPRLTHLQTAAVLRAAGYSPLGPVALNIMAPDEGNMYLLGKVAIARAEGALPAPAGRAARRARPSS